MKLAESIFLEARECRNLAQRDRYLAEACAGDCALRAEVEAMLRDAEAAAAYFEPLHSEPARVREEAGARIGRYRLLEKIGEGEMGEVYMAEQREPVVRKVALKIIKLGMDTKQVIARFEAERQALALMDHPNIAKVLDGGATESGRPYFVMELVQGLPITRFCDEARLSTRERLELFVEVCSAVQHAHQKGIIHRDIKPSNILVTLHGEKPVPKVIDFGIAKATQTRLTDKTLFTHFQHFIGTPAYMSPEQASLSGLDVDTRSDIYSLGVLLYELLTGKTPFEGKDLLDRGVEEMRRVILDSEPARPSTRLSRMRGKDLAAAALTRRTDSPRLVQLLKGDLDSIVMKAIEKDRGRRYPTANGLAADVRRHLNDEPVIARPPTAWYWFEKAVRRHRVVSTAATIVLLAILIGGYVSTRALLQARVESARAERRLRSALGFVQRVFREVAPSLAIIAGASEPHEKLARAGLDFVEELRTDSADDPELRLALASVLLRLSSATGSAPNIRADYNQSLDRASAAIALVREIDPEYRPVERLRLLHGAHMAAGVALYRLGRFNDLLQHHTRTFEVETQMRAFAEFADVLKVRDRQRAHIIGHITTLAGNPREAITRHLLPHLQEPWLAGLNDDAPLDDLAALADTHAALAFAYLQAGEPARILEPAQEAIRLRALLAARNPDGLAYLTHLAEHLALLGYGLMETEQTGEASQVFDRAHEIVERLRAKDPANDYFRECLTFIHATQARACAARALDRCAPPEQRRQWLFEAENFAVQAEAQSTRSTGAVLERMLCGFAWTDVAKARAGLEQEALTSP